MRLDESFSSYADELVLVEKGLRDIFADDVSVLPLIGDHIVGGGGKRLRPLFLLLSADLARYKRGDRIILASIIEAIHTASLLHDDVVDGADLRRGKQTAHMIWGNQIVVLVGDFLYSNALRLAVLQKNQRIMETLSGATTMMTKGEILQLHRVADPQITRQEYFEIISAKTGALISAACRIGGILGGLSPEQEDALGRFGMKTGVVFQMADDILDYMADEKGLGKKLGKDLLEGKITLPLIYLLGVAADDEKAEIREIAKNGVSRENDLGKILHYFERYKVIEESLRIAGSVVSEAKEELDVFPPSPERDALMRMCDCALERDR